MPHNVPNRPWSQVGADLFELNRQHHFLLVDYYSIEVSKLNSTRSSQIIMHRKSQFAHHGMYS